MIECLLRPTGEAPTCLDCGSQDPDPPHSVVCDASDFVIGSAMSEPRGDRRDRVIAFEARHFMMQRRSISHHNDDFIARSMHPSMLDIIGLDLGICSCCKTCIDSHFSSVVVCLPKNDVLAFFLCRTIILAKVKSG